MNRVLHVKVDASENSQILDNDFNNNNYINSNEIEFQETTRKKSLSQSYSDVLNVNNRSNSSLSAGWNVTNIIQGIGILGVPYACLKGSWIALFTNVLAAFISCSTGKMIIDCMYETIDIQKNVRIRVLDDYAEIGKKVWPRFGKAFVAITSIIEMFGASTLYLILMGLSLHTLFQEIVPQVTDQYWLIISSGWVFMILFVTKLSIISWFSLIAVIGLFGCIFSILIYCFTQYRLLSLSNFPPIEWESIPISSGIIVFSYCAHAVLPTIEGSMTRPEKFNKVMNISFFVAIITKTVFGFLPLFIFGDKIAQSISDNVPRFETGFYLTSKCLVLINSFFSMPLVIYVISDRFDIILLRNYFHTIFWPGNKLHILWIFATRLIIVLTMLLTAIIVPYFALVMSFIGSFTGTSLAFLLPCWFSLVLKAKELSSLQKLYRVLVIICGIFIGITGMYFAAKEIYELRSGRK